MPISIIIPAHNEEEVIERTLRTMTTGALPGELDIIVVPNACKDRTAEISRTFSHLGVHVLETDVPSKVNALNLGDSAALHFPRIYSDADVLLNISSIRELAKVFDDDRILAAAPSVKNVFPPDATWGVRAYYDVWMSLPYVQEGMMAAGVYAVSKKGRERFGPFPDLIADDGYFRLQYKTAERIEVKTSESIVATPAKFWDLVKIKTRSRLGYYQLRSRFPELFKIEAKSKNYGSAAGALLKRPTLWPGIVPYIWVNLLSRHRAKRQLKTMTTYTWERDNSSRASIARESRNPAPARPT